MTKFKDALKPVGKINIDRIFINSKNNQMTIVLPRKKLKCLPGRIEISYWEKDELKKVKGDKII